jgi:hypothetical protein
MSKQRTNDIAVRTAILGGTADSYYAQHKKTGIFTYEPTPKAARDAVKERVLRGSTCITPEHWNEKIGVRVI